jgi:two-component system sensor histidine kinase UhpB
VAKLKLPRRFSLTQSLRAQLVLAAVAPVVALLVALAFVGVFGFTRLTQTLVEDRDSELVQLATRQVASYWADSVLLLSSLATPDVARRGDLGASQALLGANTALRQRFDRISITNAQGRVIAAAGGEVGENMGQLAFFERARRLRRPVRSPVFLDASDNPIIAIAIPAYDMFGQFAGCVLGIWDLKGDRLGLPVARVRVGENGFAYLVNEAGTVLYHPDKEWIGADARKHPAVAALLQGSTGTQTVTLEGRQLVVGYAPLPLRQSSSSLMADESWDGWGLLTSETWDDIVAPLQPYVRLMVVLLLLAATLPLLLLVLSTRRIVAPLQSLVAQAERVASGEFDSQVSIASGPRELRELELAFNTMVDQLRRYRSDIQNYVVSILNSQEEERKRIARELHDETAQALIVLGRQIEMAEELATGKRLAAELDGLRDMVDDTLQGVRRFTSDLRPPLLEELGLPRTLELLGDRTERSENLAVQVRVTGTPRRLLPEFDLALYRLAQEGLSNVRRHAHATHVELGLTYEPDCIRLTVRDDGGGFDSSTSTADLLRSGRLGLMGIYERARLFGGKATITSSPGMGTVVTVIVPLTSLILPADKANDTPRPPS